MGKYDTSKLRNLGIVAHGEAGKTSLVEAMLFNTGMTDRLGRVDDGTSTMDFEPEEIKRRITISSSLHHCEWKGHSLHIVDTPGYTNFLHDTRNCLRILGGAVLIVSAISGVKAQTQKIWEWCQEFEVPRIAFVNKMDRDRADFLKAVDDMCKTLGTRAVLVNMPIGAAEEFRGIVDLVAMKARFFEFDEKGTFREEEIPADMVEEAQRLRALLVEAAAEADDELMEKYLETETLSQEELLRGLREATLTGTFTPVLCGSATANIGVRSLLEYITVCLPSPLDKGVQIGTNPKIRRDGGAAAGGERPLFGHGLQDHQRPLHRQADPVPGLLRGPQVRHARSTTRARSRWNASARSSSWRGRSRSRSPRRWPVISLPCPSSR